MINNEVVAVIACYNGEGTIYETVRSVLANGIRCIVVANGCKDATAARATAAGATVIVVKEGIGKPASLARAVHGLNLASKYRWILVVDDDTILRDGFIRAALRSVTPETACVVGNTQSDFPSRGKLSYNPYMGLRALAFWRYSFLRRGKSALNAVDVIAGSNTVFRATLLSELLARPSKILVDDTQWMWEIHREGLGRIDYAHDAVAFTQDPSTYKDWRKQELRWLGGTFQGIIMGKPGSNRTWFDVVFLGQIADWVLYVLGLPMLCVFMLLTTDPAHTAVVATAGTAAWTTVAACALRRPKLLLLLPVFYLLDIVYRAIMIQAVIAAIRTPTIDGALVWTSPERINS